MAMSDKHKQLLRNNRVDIVKNMQIDEELLSYLMTDNILSSDMKERIEVGITFLLLLSEILRM